MDRIPDPARLRPWHRDADAHDRRPELAAADDGLHLHVAAELLPDLRRRRVSDAGRHHLHKQPGHGHPQQRPRRKPVHYCGRRRVGHPTGRHRPGPAGGRPGRVQHER